MISITDSHVPVLEAAGIWEGKGVEAKEREGVEGKGDVIVY